MKPIIIYTETDEAPALATRSLLPVIRAFAKTAGIDIETRDISLAGRIIAAFPESLKDDQRQPDALTELGQRVTRPEANIIKLPNISASVPQLKAAIRELREEGYDLPDYPEEPANDREKAIRRRYDHIKGSAVNPVLREGNSDRRAPGAVKRYARNHPHAMGAWEPNSRTHVSSMESGDFYGSELSIETAEDTDGRIEFIGTDGTILLKEHLSLEAGEIADAAVMNIRSLDEFLTREISDAEEKNLLFSLHLKATMMKVSDPVIFGRAVLAYFRDLFDTYGKVFRGLGINPNNGLGDLLEKIKSLPEEQREAIRQDIRDRLARGPGLAMVDVEKNITNLHVPSDIIIDASMPAAIRSSGKMRGPGGDLRDMKAVIPDRTYAGVYREAVAFCREHGTLDPAVLGSVANVGLMARQAEEYGSHDTTFIAPGNGIIRLCAAEGTSLLERPVETGDIFRVCRAKDEAVRNWVSLAVQRARLTGIPAVFWLDTGRAHDRRLAEKVRKYLADHDTSSLDIRIMDPPAAVRYTMERMTAGEDTISVTGNVLRDYLTDLFPILELGTSAKMLSIVSLMNGGRLFETGAGGSAPRHVRQFLTEGHLRWDSLGEYLALAESLRHLASACGNERARILADALDKGTEELLENEKSPSRSTGEIDTRGSHFYLAMYWARALASQTEDRDLQRCFSPPAKELADGEEAVMDELTECQGGPVDIGGYYHPDTIKAERAMRPSETFNAAINRFSASLP